MSLLERQLLQLLKIHSLFGTPKRIPTNVCPNKQNPSDNDSRNKQQRHLAYGTSECPVCTKLSFVEDLPAPPSDGFRLSVKPVLPSGSTYHLVYSQGSHLDKRGPTSGHCEDNFSQILGELQLSFEPGCRSIQFSEDLKICKKEQSGKVTETQGNTTKEAFAIPLSVDKEECTGIDDCKASCTLREEDIPEELFEDALSDRLAEFNRIYLGEREVSPLKEAKKYESIHEELFYDALNDNMIKPGELTANQVDSSVYLIGHMQEDGGLAHQESKVLDLMDEEAVRDLVTDTITKAQTRNSLADNEMNAGFTSREGRGRYLSKAESQPGVFREMDDCIMKKVHDCPSANSEAPGSVNEMKCKDREKPPLMECFDEDLRPKSGCEKKVKKKKYPPCRSEIKCENPNVLPKCSVSTCAGTLPKQKPGPICKGTCKEQPKEKRKCLNMDPIKPRPACLDCYISKATKPPPTGFTEVKTTKICDPLEPPQKSCVVDMFEQDPERWKLVCERRIKKPAPTCVRKPLMCPNKDICREPSELVKHIPLPRKAPPTRARPICEIPVWTRFRMWLNTPKPLKDPCDEP